MHTKRHDCRCPGCGSRLDIHTLRGGQCPECKRVIKGRELGLVQDVANQVRTGTATYIKDRAVQSQEVTMYDCPNFQSCSAPLCPLDPDWRDRSCHPDDDNCRMMLNSVKDGAEERIPERILEACRAMSREPALPLSITTALKQAKRTGWKNEHFRKPLRARAGG